MTISKDDTIILDGGGEKSAINERCDQLRESVSASTSDYDRRVPKPFLPPLASAWAPLKPWFTRLHLLGCGPDWCLWHLLLPFCEDNAFM